MTFIFGTWDPSQRSIRGCADAHAVQIKLALDVTEHYQLPEPGIKSIIWNGVEILVTKKWARLVSPFQQVRLESLDRTNIPRLGWYNDGHRFTLVVFEVDKFYDNLLRTNSNIGQHDASSMAARRKLSRARVNRGGKKQRASFWYLLKLKWYKFKLNAGVIYW